MNDRFDSKAVILSQETWTAAIGQKETVRARTARDSRSKYWLPDKYSSEFQGQQSSAAPNLLQIQQADTRGDLAKASLLKQAAEMNVSGKCSAARYHCDRGDGYQGLDGFHGGSPSLTKMDWLFGRFRFLKKGTHGALWAADDALMNS